MAVMSDGGGEPLCRTTRTFRARVMRVVLAARRGARTARAPRSNARPLNNQFRVHSRGPTSRARSRH